MVLGCCLQWLFDKFVQCGGPYKCDGPQWPVHSHYEAWLRVSWFLQQTLCASWAIYICRQTSSSIFWGLFLLACDFVGNLSRNWDFTDTILITFVGIFAVGRHLFEVDSYSCILGGCICEEAWSTGIVCPTSRCSCSNCNDPQSSATASFNQSSCTGGEHRFELHYLAEAATGGLIALSVVNSSWQFF